MSQYIENVWKFLLISGGVVEDESNISYYSHEVPLNEALSEEVASKIKSGILVDLENCSDPASHTARFFNGTFTNSELEVYYLLGNLVLSDGSSYRWGANIGDGDYGLDKMIKTLLTLPDWSTVFSKVEDHWG